MKREQFRRIIKRNPQILEGLEKSLMHLLHLQDSIVSDNHRIEKGQSLLYTANEGVVYNGFNYIRVSKPQSSTDLLLKSWSTEVMKNNPGSRWVTITDPSSPLRGRHILIMPHGDGTATVLHAPVYSGLQHKVIAPRKSGEKKPEKGKKIKAKMSPKEQQEADRKLAAATAKIDHLKKLRNQKREEMKNYIEEQTEIEIGVTEKDRKRIDKMVRDKIKKLKEKKPKIFEDSEFDEDTAIDEETKHELRKLRQEKKQRLDDAINKAKEQMFAEKSGIDIDTSKDDEKAREMRELVKDKADDLLRFHYEIKEYDKVIRKIRREIRKDVGKFNSKVLSLEVEEISDADVERMVAGDRSMQDEIEAHYKLVLATRGGIDKNGKEIKPKGSSIIKRNIEKGAFEAFNAISRFFTSMNVVDSDKHEILGNQNAAMLLNHYLKNNVEGWDGKLEDLREYAELINGKIAQDALDKGDRLMELGQKVKEQGYDENSLFASISQAIGTSRQFINKAYAAYGQAEGALNQMAELMYVTMQGDNLEQEIRLSAAAKATLDRQRGKLGLNASDVNIYRMEDGHYEMSIKEESFHKLENEKFTPQEAITTPYGDMTPAQISRGAANDENWLPEGVNPYFDVGDGKMQKLTPSPYQQSAAKLAAQQKRVYLDHEAGTGKSLTYLLAKAEIEKQKGRSLKTIISMPDKITKNFVEEIEKFTDYECEIVSGKAKAKRAEILANPEPGKIYIVNHGAYRNDIDAIKQGGYEFVVADEAHEITHRQKRSKQSQQSQGLSDVVKSAEYYIAGTGTPTPNDLSELYFHLNLIDPHKYGSQKEFMKKYGNVSQSMGFKAFAKSMLNVELSDHLHVVQKHLDTKFTMQEHTVELTDWQKQEYRQANQEYLDRKHSGEQYKGNAFSRDAKIRKVINALDPEHNKQFAKADAIIQDHINNRKDPKQKVGLLVRTKKHRDALVKYLEAKYGEGCCVRFDGDTSKTQAKKNKDKVKKDDKVKFSIHMKAGVTGLNLQYDGNDAGLTTMIAFGSDNMWGWSDIDQFNSRGNRKGAVADIEGHIIRSENPYDFKNEMRVKKKKDVLDLLYDSRKLDADSVLDAV